MKPRIFLFIFSLFFLITSVGTPVGATPLKKKHKKKHKQTEQKISLPSDENSVPPSTEKSKAELKKERKERKKKEKEARKELKREKKEKKKQEKAEKKKKGKKELEPKAAPAPQPVTLKKWSDIEYPTSQRKQSYRIEVLIPMYLDELVKNGYPVKEIPEKALAGLDFYKGLLIAADSLKKAGFNLDIFVHDISSLNESMDLLLKKHALDTADLIISTALGNDISALASFVRQKGVNCVSAISAIDGKVIDNKYFTTTEPTNHTYSDVIKKDIAAHKLTKRPLLIYRTLNPADAQLAPYFIDKAGNEIFTMMLANKVPDRATLKNAIDTAGANLLCVPINDVKFLDSLFGTLRRGFPAATFTVYGFPNQFAKYIKSASATYNQFTFRLPVSFGDNLNGPVFKYIDTAFSNEYGGHAGEFVCRGFESLYWHANLLKRYGTIYNTHYLDIETAPFTKFEITPIWDTKYGNVDYFENKKVLFKEIHGGQLKYSEITD